MNLRRCPFCGNYPTDGNVMVWCDLGAHPLIKMSREQWQTRDELLAAEARLTRQMFRAALTILENSDTPSDRSRLNGLITRSRALLDETEAREEGQ